ncbi:hypothetical protein [Microbulbifer magnicolonia]|uniref:hypothetical protein n=1 Tax=Microbulbifer magnicolonia TaxID=3109744 RepID=UPI002B4006B6|nr:hypothetical protein [Microbulbifer sp. GG15]
MKAERDFREMARTIDKSVSAAAPKSLLLLAVFMLCAAAIIDRALLIDIGLMRRSLTHPDLRVQEIAALTVSFARIMMAGLGILLSLVYFYWDRLLDSAAMKYLEDHVPAYPWERYRERLLNRSLLVMAIALAASVLFVAEAPRLIEAGTLSFIVNEDGLLESITALLFLASSAVALGTARLDVTPRHKYILWIMALAFFLCFGEEISWGQRIFDISTPEALATINAQQEINLHNSFGYLADHLFIIVVFCYGFLVPALASISPVFYNLMDRFGIPIASMGLAIGFLGVSLFHDFIFWRWFSPWGLRIAELRELLSSLGILLILLETRRIWLLSRATSREARASGSALTTK